MHQPAHACFLAGTHQPARQLHVHLLEVGLAAVQDRHQVDHRIGLAQRVPQLGVVVHVDLVDHATRQRLQVPRMPEPARQHPQRPRTPAMLDQLLADVGADEATATQDHHTTDGHALTS
jgi:hypothetical protein